MVVWTTLRGAFRAPGSLAASTPVTWTFVWLIIEINRLRAKRRIPLNMYILLRNQGIWHQCSRIRSWLNSRIWRGKSLRIKGYDKIRNRLARPLRDRKNNSIVGPKVGLQEAPEIQMKRKRWKKGEKEANYLLRKKKYRNPHQKRRRRRSKSHLSQRFSCLLNLLNPQPKRKRE